jgi:hypothetical protein
MLVSILVIAGCGLVPQPRPAGIAADLPQSIGGQRMVYSEHSGTEMGPIFFEDPIKAVGGSLDTARVAVGGGPDGLTLTAVRVPGVDAKGMLDPMIKSAGFNETASAVVVVGGKNATVLTLPPTTPDRAYLYAYADTLVVITTFRPAFAEEALRALP